MTKCISLLTGSELNQALIKLNQGLECPWLIEKDYLIKSFTFVDFITTFGFMTRVALWAEKMNHHPDWSNTYNQLVIKLRTHDVNGITALDFSLAQQIEELVHD